MFHVRLDFADAFDLQKTVEWSPGEERKKIKQQWNWSKYSIFALTCRCDLADLRRFVCSWLAATWPSFLQKRDRQNHTAVDKLKYVSPTFSMHSSCWDCILALLLLLDFKLLSCKNASGRLGIINAYRMENLSVWRDKVTVLLFSHERRQIKFRACAASW